MIRNLLILVALMAAVAGYTYYSDFFKAPSAVPKNSDTTLFKPIPAPDFTFKDRNNTPIRLSDFKDRIVVLNFWATWCAPCVIEFPQMLSLAKKLEGKAVFLFLSVDDNAQDVERFLNLKKNHVLSKNVYVGIDTEKHISRDLYDSKKYPETYLIGPGLMIHDKVIGASKEWDSDTVLKTISALDQK